MKLSNLIIAGCTIAGLFAFSFAAESTSSAPAKKSTVAAVKNISGTIESINAINNTVVVKTATTSDTLKVDSTTTITANGKMIALTDLKAGSNVSASYKEVDGTKQAVTIKEKVKAEANSSAPTTK